MKLKYSIIICVTSFVLQGRVGKVEGGGGSSNVSFPPSNQVIDFFVIAFFAVI